MFPTLDEFLKAGVIWQEENGTFFGRAEDSVVVQLGNSRKDVEVYLNSHPTPSHW